MTATTLNSKPRKSLAGQIDRLDDILDGLADGLNDAVAMVVMETVAVAVKEAVNGVMAELLTNPDVLRKLQSTFAAPKPKTPQPVRPTLKERVSGMWQKFIGGCRWLGSVSQTAVANAAKGTASLVREAAGATIKATIQVAASCAALGRFKKQILLAVVIGTLVALGTWYAGPWLSTLAGWAGGFATTLAVQCALWLRRMTQAVQELSGPPPAWAGAGGGHSN